MHPRARLLLLDVLAVLVFVLVGRRTHDEGSAIAGIVRTAGPFLIALVTGWASTKAWSRPFQGPTGVVVYGVTLVGGMVLRRTLFDRGTAPAFVIVAAIFLAVTMLGWRFVAWRSAARSTSRESGVQRA